MPDRRLRENEDFCSARLSFNSPILPYFLSMFVAFFLSGTFESLRTFTVEFFSVGIFFILSEITLRFVYGIFSYSPQSRFLKFIFYLARYAGVFFICCWYFYFRIPQNPYEDFAPRETSVIVSIDEVSKGVNDSRYGIATIVEAPYFLRNAVGMPIWYTISDGKNRKGKNKDIIVSQEVYLTGVISSTFPSNTKARGHYTDKPETRAFEKYLRQQFIYFKIFSKVDNAEILVPPQTSREFFESVRRYMERSLSSFYRLGFSETTSARAYRAMILGDKSLLTKEQKQSYMDTGTMHVFAISGLHIGFAAASIFFVLSLLRLNWRIMPFVALPILYLYVCACGSRPSALRAFGMIALFWLAISLVRGIRPFSTLILAATIALIISPAEIFDAGFALSYSIVASIFVYSIPLFNYFSYLTSPSFDDAEFSRTKRFLLWIKSYFLAAFCISLGALFVGASLSSHYFSYVAPMSIFYSPFFVSGAGIAVMLGFVGFVLPDFLAKCLNEISVLIMGCMSEFAITGAKIWSGRFDFAMPSLLLSYVATIGFLAISVALAKKRSPIKRFLLAPIFVVLIMFISWIQNA